MKNANTIRGEEGLSLSENQVSNIYAFNADLVSFQRPSPPGSGVVPDSLQKYIIPGTVPRVISGRFGHLLFQEFQHCDNSPYIRYSQYILKEEQLFTFYSEQAQLRLQFDLSNNFYLDMEGIGKWKVAQGTYNLFFVPFLDARVRLRPGKVYATLNIYFQYDQLVRLGEYSQFLYDFLQKVHAGQPSLFHTVNQPITITMERIIQEILISYLKGPFLSVYLENKINDLLLSCLDPTNASTTHKSYYNDEIETDQLYEAKKIWLENIQNPLSLAALSKKTGLNIKKLKTGFKRLFDQSPYNLLLKVRMETAERLLSETDLSVSDISDQIGYVGIQSFSKAFKLFFKESPLQYRKKLR